MKKIPIFIFAILLSFNAIAQLEIKPDSFKESSGFVNVNPDANYQYDDNDLPFAVIKVRTENITDKQRRELIFGGNAGTFIVLEYKTGEVWVYLTAKYADYLKISHPDFGVVEFTFPYDLQPKKGYELALIYKPYTPDEPVYGTLDVVSDPMGAIVYIDGLKKGKTPLIINDILVGTHELRLEKSGYLPLQKSFSLNGYNVLKINEKLSVDPKAISSIEDNKEKIKGLKPNVEFTKYTFVTLNYAIDSYSKPSFGLSFGIVKKYGWYINAMSNFNFKGFSTDYECNSDFMVNGDYPVYSGVELYSSISATMGFIYRISNPIALRVGVGYGIKNLVYEMVDNKYVKNTDVSVTGVNISIGTILKLKRFVVSLDGVTTNFKCFEANLGVGIVL